jgi:hypothetical protein
MVGGTEAASGSSEVVLARVSSNRAHGSPPTFFQMLDAAFVSARSTSDETESRTVGRSVGATQARFTPTPPAQNGNVGWTVPDFFWGVSFPQKNLRLGSVNEDSGDDTDGEHRAALASGPH